MPIRMSNETTAQNTVSSHSHMPPHFKKHKHIARVHQRVRSLGQWHPYPCSCPMLGRDIFNLIKALSTLLILALSIMAPAVYWLHGLWVYWSVMGVGGWGAAGALSARDHMDQKPLCLSYGPSLSAADADVWRQPGHAPLPLPIINPSLDSSLLLNLCSS